MISQSTDLNVIVFVLTLMTLSYPFAVFLHWSFYLNDNITELRPQTQNVLMKNRLLTIINARVRL